MNISDFINKAESFTNESEFNFISADIAIKPEYEEMRIFDSPMFGFASAGDPIFESFISPEIIGGHYLTPSAWLPGAKSVVSYFLPFTGKINESNARDNSWPSDEWLHGRIEGQIFIIKLSAYLTDLLINAGFNSVSPVLDARYGSGSATVKFSSNWSERHAAYACGLGTFGLSKNLITKKGVCGRFGSLITEYNFPAADRLYNGVYEYCTMCGACVKNCPAGAISLEEGKKHEPCSNFVNSVMEKHGPRYGCGKCQVNVPCGNRAPVKIN